MLSVVIKPTLNKRKHLNSFAPKCVTIIILMTFHSSSNSNLSSSVEVLVTLTTDVGRILSKLHSVSPDGNINLLTGIRIAHVSITKIIFIHCGYQFNKL